MRNLAEAIILAEELHRKSHRKDISALSELPEHPVKFSEKEGPPFEEDFQN
jgi:hypothetical protein